MIIPGGVIMAIILLLADSPHSSFQILVFDDCIIKELGWDAIDYIIFFVASYILGLINNWISDGIFKGFRNYNLAIRIALNDIIRIHGNINLKKLNGLAPYVRSKDKHYCLCCILFFSFVEIIKSLPPCIRPVNKPLIILYHRVYYNLWQNRLLGSIPLIESQVALLRNILIPISIFLLFFRDEVNINVNCTTTIIILLFILILFTTMVQRQQKIYRMVWETYNYVSHED